MRSFRLQAVLLVLVALTMIALSVGQVQADPKEMDLWVHKGGQFEFRRVGKGPNWEEWRGGKATKGKWTEDRRTGARVFIVLQDERGRLEAELAPLDATLRLDGKILADFLGGWK